MSDLSVAIVSVSVKDQGRARDFYRDKLGFDIDGLVLTQSAGR